MMPLAVAVLLMVAGAAVDVAILLAAAGLGVLAVAKVVTKGEV